jgi:hypothetical protein
VFFVHGAASQSLDGFVDRLGKETIRRLLAAINNTNQIEWKWVAWPDGRLRSITRRGSRYMSDRMIEWIKLKIPDGPAETSDPARPARPISYRSL